MYRSNAETIYELSTFPRFYPLLTTAQTFEITALSSRRALKMFLLLILAMVVHILLVIWIFNMEIRPTDGLTPEIVLEMFCSRTGRDREWL